MRSLNPLTLKLHITENWTNIILYNNYSNDLHKALYLNKWMKQYFSKKNNLVSRSSLFENKKKIYIKLDATFFDFLFNKKNYKFLFKKLRRTRRRRFLLNALFTNFASNSVEQFSRNMRYRTQLSEEYFMLKNHPLLDIMTSISTIFEKKNDAHDLSRRKR